MVFAMRVAARARHWCQFLSLFLLHHITAVCSICLFLSSLLFIINNIIIYTFFITHAEHFIHGRPFPSLEVAPLLHEAAAADNTNLGRLNAGAELLCLEMATVTPDSPTNTIRSMFKDVEKRQGWEQTFTTNTSIHAEKKWRT